MKPIKVLSCFDGISAGQLALQRAGIPVSHYFASEIDPYAIQITQKNFPNTIQLGDIRNYKNWNQIYPDLSNIDLIIGGSPCQGFSQAGLGMNFDDPRSKLFWLFVDVLIYYLPIHFLLENVPMKKEWQDIITEAIGEVEPFEINSALVSAQNRRRLYWTDIPNVTQPEDKHILLRDIVLSDAEPVVLHNLYGGFKEKQVRTFTEKSPTIRTSAGGGHIPSVVLKDLIHSPKALAYMDREVADGRNHWDFGHFSDIGDNKSSAVVANFFKGVPYNVFKDWNCIRKFHPIECERLQTFPDNYTEGISDTQRYKCLGNSWTVDVIAHIFSFLKES